MFYYWKLGVWGNGDDPKPNEERGREAILEVIGKTEVPIKRIICVGLGSLRPATSRKDSEFFLHQRYTALDLAGKLNAPISFHDPEYDEGDERFLQNIAVESNTNIKFLTTQQAVLDIDEYTLVFATGKPGSPIRQLVVALTHTHGDPAAIFFENLSERTSTGPEGKEWTMEDELSLF
jgi:hypothetical protein